MKYEYECPTHGPFRSDIRSDSLLCEDITCTQVAIRRWGFHVASSFQPHYNPSVGMNVSSEAQLRSEMSRVSEEASRPVTNYLSDGTPVTVERPPVNFVPVDARDKATLGVTNDGLDATYDRWKSEGRDDDARKLKRLMDE